MGNIWFSADLHINHPKVALLRGFNDVDDHDEYIIARFRKYVKPGDTLYLLGDLFMGPHKSDYMEHFVFYLQGVTLHAVIGNHDRGHPCNNNSHTYLKEWYALFDSATTAAKINYQGETYLLSHFPYTEDRGDEIRYEQWRLKDLGTPLIHGHLHDTVKVRKSIKGTLQYHCGLDAWNLKPVNIHDLLSATLDS